jgi:hypothetical protein
MPERWITELGKIDRLEPSPDVLERAQRGPTLAPPRPHLLTRVAIALFALAIAVGGTLGAFVALRGSSRVGTADGASGFDALWPETSLSRAKAVQASVDAGDEGLQWRTDPAAVGLRFVKDVLGWPRPIAGVTSPHGDTVTVDLHGPDATCDGASCPEQTIVVLTMQRLVRSGEGGIWSVFTVKTSGIGLPVDAAHAISVGSRLHITSRHFGQGLLAIAGYHFRGPGDCDIEGYGTSGHVDSGEVTLAMPEDIADDCGPVVHGYIFAYSAPVFDVNSADPFLDAVHPLVLSAVPVVLTRSG